MRQPCRQYTLTSLHFWTVSTGQVVYTHYLFAKISYNQYQNEVAPFQANFAGVIWSLIATAQCPVIYSFEIHSLFWLLSNLFAPILGFCQLYVQESVTCVDHAIYRVSGTPMTCARSLGLQHSFYSLQQTVFFVHSPPVMQYYLFTVTAISTIFNNRFLPFAISFGPPSKLSTGVRIKRFKCFFALNLLPENH